nr:MAG TPA: hypothetical protein [Caudoviricetes sp.]
MNEYLRLGEIPTNESSYNFLTKCQEAGVSVFEYVDSKPVLSNLQLVDSFSGRNDHKAYVVTGDVVGVGFDGEPLLKNVNIIREIELDFMAITLEVMNKSFKNVSGSLNEKHDKMHPFWIANLKNKKTGELKPDWNLVFDAKVWEKVPAFWEYSYAGFDFSNPIEGFNTKMGKERNL